MSFFIDLVSGKLVLPDRDLSSGGGGGGSSNFLGNLNANPNTAVSGDYYFNTLRKRYFFYNSSYDIWLGDRQVTVEPSISGGFPTDSPMDINGITNELSTAPNKDQSTGFIVPFNCILDTITIDQSLTPSSSLIKCYNIRKWDGVTTDPTFEVSIATDDSNTLFEVFELVPNLTSASEFYLQKGDVLTFLIDNSSGGGAGDIKAKFLLTEINF